MEFKATLPVANPPFCWICDRKLYGGGRFYSMVKDPQGVEHPVHKRCAEEVEEETDGNH